jgi:glycerol kinase
MALHTHSLTQGNSAPLLLALDQGGHASRALVFDAQGRQLIQAYAAISTQRPSAERVEHDAHEVLESMRTVIADIAHTLGNDTQRLVAAGMATQRSSIVCWDAIGGAPLSPVLSWQDRRNAARVSQLEPRRDEIQRLTGLVLSPHYGASKLRWCLDELPQVQQAHAANRLQAGPLASYLLQGLLNQGAAALVDPANASRTQLWSPATRNWSPSLLEWFGVPREVLPRSVPTRYAYGSLDIAGHAVPLTICTGDQAAVPFAQGELQDDTIYLNLGTGAFALAPLDHDIEDVAPLLRSVVWSDDHHTRYALEGTINGAGSALQWLNERSGLDIERAAQALQRTQVANLNVPLFINGIGGIGSPYWLPQVESHFVSNEGGATHDDRAALVAVIESIAFLIAANLREMRKRAPQLKRIVAGGGLAACSYLCECLAGLSELPLTRLSETELTAKGLAFLVANQPSEWLPDANAATIAPIVDKALHARHVVWQQHMSHLIGSSAS